MLRQAARLDGNQVITPAIVCIMGAPGHPEVRRAGDALPACGRDGAEGMIAVGAGLHFDEGDEPAFGGDEVNLADRRAQARLDNALAHQA